MKKSSKICKKDEGVAIMLEDGGGIGFENKLWDNVTKRSMKKGGNANKSSVVDVEDIKSKMYNWFTAWFGNFISDEELVNSLKRKLGTKWFRFFKGDTMASDWQSVQNSMKTKNNREFLKENMQIALDEKSLEIYNSKGIKLAKGGSLESELPSDTEQLVKEGKVTYRGMGFGASGVKLKVKGKEYIVSDEKFKSLGGVSKIKFNAPFRQFGKGTTIEGSEVSLHLPVEMSVYVPSTKDANVPVSKSELSKRVNEVKEYLANLFGGYSSSQIIGGYASNEGSLIQEDVVKVISFATKKAYEENKQKLINKIASWSTAWSQEAIGFELEGDLYYINQDKKMAKGGNTDSYNIQPSRYDFRRRNFSDNINELFIEGYTRRPTKKQVLDDLKHIKDKFKKGSEYNDFSPVVAVVYPYQYGWSNGYKIIYHSNKEDLRNGYFDEVNGRRDIYELQKLSKGGVTDCGCHKKMSKGGNTDCGCWHYEIGGL